MRSKGDETHENTRDQTSSRDGNDPSKIDPGDHAPVDSTPVTVAETNTDNGTSDTLGGGDGKLCSIEVSLVSPV